MARVYISSTWLDLKAEREAVRNAILRLGHTPAGMEAYNSSESPPLARCLEDVATCDVYLGICAWRCGFVPRGETRSITECEYDEAGRREIPRLLFLLAADAPWPMERADLDRGQVVAWRARLEQRHIVAYFSTAGDLAGKAIASLVEQLRPAAPVSIPPLLPYLSDRGRQEEAIDRALSGDAARPLVCIVHGDEHQSHDQLLRRLKDDMLPRLLQLDVPVTALVMGWPPDFASVGELRGLLLRGLATELSLPRQSSLARIDAALEALPGPALVHTHVLSRDFEGHGARLLEAFLSLWQGWPELRPGRRLVPLLFVHYQLGAAHSPWQRFRLRRLNRQLARSLEALDERGAPVGGELDDLSRFDRLTVRVLPQLEGVTQTEAETWALSDPVTRVCPSAELVADIRQLYRDYEARTDARRIPMDTLARELRRLLERRCRQETFA
jgi:Domain of unknown function (DUF4062)/inactive STAND